MGVIDEAHETVPWHTAGARNDVNRDGMWPAGQECMRSIPLLLRALAASALATVACGDEVSQSPTSPHPTSPGGDDHHPPVTPTSESGFVPVPCRADDETRTDLGSVRDVLGEDYLGAFSTFSAGQVPTPFA